VCQESHYAEQIVSSAGAIGLMQLMPATARTQARKIGVPFATDRLYDGQYNVQIGVAHVAELEREFSGDSLLVLAAYNAGKSAAQMWFEEFGDADRDVFVEKIPYRETRLFVKRIIEHIAAYRRLYPDLLNGQPTGDRAESPRP
jgi:soluble lytic murein transglycosylase